MSDNAFCLLLVLILCATGVALAWLDTRKGGGQS